MSQSPAFTPRSECINLAGAAGTTFEGIWQGSFPNETGKIILSCDTVCQGCPKKGKRRRLYCWLSLSSSPAVAVYLLFGPSLSSLASGQRRPDTVGTVNCRSRLRLTHELKLTCSITNDGILAIKTLVHSHTRAIAPLPVQACLLMP